MPAIRQCTPDQIRHALILARGTYAALATSSVSFPARQFLDDFGRVFIFILPIDIAAYHRACLFLFYISYYRRLIRAARRQKAGRLYLLPQAKTAASTR